MINWRDVQERAVEFAFRYADARDEDRDKQSFWKDLLALYGVDPRQIGAFEERVRIHGRPGVGKIDYFAPHKFIIEHKSKGKDLEEAFEQAMDYFDALPVTIRPRWIIVSDFARVRVYDLESPVENRVNEFELGELAKHVQVLAFFSDEDVRVYKPEGVIDVKAVRAIGKLYEALRLSNYPPEHISPLLTRLVFLFFADDTGIFEQNVIRAFFEENTKPDGSDIGNHLSSIFQVLDTPPERRQNTLVAALDNLPYVNGGLFKEVLPVVFASRAVRDTIITCSSFDWSQVSPAIFGSMFQSVMDEKQRHDLGAHYTSEKNILKVIGPLFLDALHEELQASKTNKEKLVALQERLAGITLLDPACGCGNFLVIAYRELRTIENEIIARLYGREDKKGFAHVATHTRLDLGEVDLKKLSKLSVERMYGIEIEAFPAEVAKLSLWLTDHLMNVELGKIFGKPLTKLPLTEAPHIVCGNALTLDWETVVSKDKLTHILGNPPFVGSKVMSDEQRAEITTLFENVRGSGTLDFVTGWYIKAARYIQDTDISCAFVSTNSITQGEQVAVLWKSLHKLGLKITFAHRTFKWSNEATGKAAVYCVIIGFDRGQQKDHRLFEYQDIRGDAIEVKAKYINAYLVDGPDVLIENRSKPLCDVPEIGIGNKPIDGGMYLFTPEERDAFIAKEPSSQRFFRRWIGSDEFINGYERWCLWLGDAQPDELRAMPEVMRRIEAVRQFRLMSRSEPTRKLADTPTHFHVENIPNENYLVIPETSSENRHYIPIGFINPETLSSNALKIMPGANLWHFGVLESEMHMAWMRAVCGRLESRYRYSKDIVYNNFPWPENPTDTQKKAVEDAAQVVLDVRAKYPNATLADLYDRNSMPPDLLAAHHTLDRAVDACYGKKIFKSEPERLEFLFERYEVLVHSRIIE